MNQDSAIPVSKLMKSTKTKKLKNHSYAPLAGYLFISPWLIGFVILTVWPMVQSLYYTFTDFSLLSPPRWVGMQNFKEISEDRYFYNSLKVTFTFVLTSVPGRLIFALLVALLLNKKIKGISFYRTIIYLPSLIGGSVAVAVLWKNIFGINGFINHIVPLLGIEPKNWIGTPGTALGTLVTLSVWQFGSAMIIFLAGLKQIPSELYEASDVDGASRLRQFFTVTLPLLSPVIFFNLIMSVINSFQSFTAAFVVTNGGPLNSTEMYALYLYQKAFATLHMGYASALAWILLVIVAIATAINFIASKYWVFYENDAGGRR
ncbi:sugar ABC transporter permease [Paenibacillus frigoriresistens]|uniref:carbohydrate ABC transporter permease n=1 Tax=Paenibacillus alginolyticus TaxID=59839 RepID=UPI0015664DF2|nr:sugar ABC transporter permease [Paenibacillus frigoriresistens]NRF95982.1 sugar ABC transporter permease [Paenibacillus frigoriresistens]